METILKLSIGLLLVFDVYVLYKVYNALNESYIVNLIITV